MDLKYLIVLVGFVCVFEAEAATSELSRSKRDDGGFNVVEMFMKLNQLLDSCKKSDAPASNNQTNPVVQFIEGHDMQCLVNGFLMMYKDMVPKESSRKKRDTANILMEFLQLQQDIEKCKKSDASPSTSTNIIEKVMNDYDIGCLAKTVMEFVKSALQSNNHQRSKRSIGLSDITCVLMKLISNQSKIEEVVNAFKPKEEGRSKRAASSQQICDDFGSTMDAFLKFALDFAPNQPSN